MSIDQNDVNDALDRDVVSSEGEKIGTVGQVYLDDVTGTPEWVTVLTGMFGTKETFVPIADAELTQDGLTVPYSKDQVKDAPNIDADAGHLSPAEEDELYRHYGLEQSRPTDEPQEALDVDDTAGGEALTRSEERLQVGTRTEETGRARLRKYVVTEDETVTVPVRKEKVVLEREPIDDADRDQDVAGSEISEQEVEVVLHEERPVVEKETVAVEKVALGTETVVSEEQVTETVRKEQIDTDGVEDDDRNAGR